MTLRLAIKKYAGELVFIFSNSYTLVASMLVSIIATAFIEPSDMGVIQTVLLVQVYLNFLHFGVFNGLNRNIAFYKARKEDNLVQDMVNTSYTVSYIVAGIGALVAIGFLIYYAVRCETTVYILSSILLLFLLIFQPLNNVVEATFRSGQQFKQLGKINTKASTIYIVLSLLPIAIGYIGKIIADSLRFVVSYLLKIPYKPYKQTGAGSISSLKLLVSTGFPMLLSGYLWTVFVACDRTFIASHFSKTDLGLYALAGYVMTAVMMLPNSVNSLLYPKAAARYGQTNDPHSLYDFWKKSILIYFVLLVPVCVVLYYAIPFLVPLFMPKYEGGIVAAQYSLLTCITYISSGPAVIFGTLRKNNLYILVLLLSIALFWAAALIFDSYFSSIERVAFLRFVISLIKMIFILFITFKYVKK